jgi:hypothetical protein
MNWKFWQKEKQTDKFSGAKEIKLAKPREIPDRVGRYLVTQLKEDPDWVWSLRAALRPKGDEKDTFEIRIFDPEQVARKGALITNFNALDAHPDMILFTGWYKKNTDLVKIEKALKDAA